MSGVAGPGSAPRLPRAARARVDGGKVDDYLLSPHHPDGRSKAAFFGAFGFSPVRWERLAAALREQGATGRVTAIAASEYGTRYSVDGVIETPDGRNPGYEPSGSSTKTGSRV